MSEHTVEQATAKRLERSRSDRMLAGVCGGLARYFDIHPAFYRVGFVVLTLIGGAGILIYVAAALVIPDEGHEDSIAAVVLRERRDRPWPLIGLGLVAVAGVVLVGRASLWPHGDFGWVIVLLAGAAILMLSRRSPRPVDREDERPFPEGGGETATRVIARPRRGRWVLKGLAWVVGVLVALVLVAAAVVVAALPVHLTHGVGDRTYAVSDASRLRPSYSLGVGNLTLDLRSAALPPGQTYLRARVDVGKLYVVVPANAALEANGEAHFGQVKLLGNSTDGRDAVQTIRESGDRVLVLDANVGAGEIVVSRAVR
jgi:phage shock protein PspC (stress-responsive transcriptional regulator)